MDESPIDDVDRGILHQLQKDARQTDTEVGEKVDVTSTTVRNRLDRLEDQGVIRGYHPEIDYEKAGYPLNVLFICTADPRDLESITEQALEIHGVVTVRELLGGEQNLHVEIVAATVDEVENVRNELASLGPSIGSSEIISETQVQPWNHFYPATGPDAAPEEPSDDETSTDQA